MGSHLMRDNDTPTLLALLAVCSLLTSLLSVCAFWRWEGALFMPSKLWGAALGAAALNPHRHSLLTGLLSPRLTPLHQEATSCSQRSPWGTQERSSEEGGWPLCSRDCTS